MDTVLPNLMWFDLTDPDAPELDELAQRYGLHELQIEDCRHRPQRPKTEVHGHYNFAILKQIHSRDREVTFGDVDLLPGPDFLISVRKGEPGLICRW